MKRYVKSNTESKIKHIDVVVELEFDNSSDIAAATYSKDDFKFHIPDGDLLPYEKDAIISSQAGADYEAFIESVIDLIEDYYNLNIYYKNESEDFSWYFGMLAKNDDESIIIDFDFTLRVSNHSAHRTPQSQQHKRERKAMLKEITKGKKTKPIVKIILVNNQEFNTYLEAYKEIDKLIDEVVDVMKRNY